MLLGFVANRTQARPERTGRIDGANSKWSTTIGLNGKSTARSLSYQTFTVCLARTTIIGGLGKPLLGRTNSCKAASIRNTSLL